uniref:Large subunit GTPase 1 homolog n=1 Tax=Stegastes partitus TaxID=144197 RepID=A0A3B4ZM32_9TELE
MGKKKTGLGRALIKERLQTGRGKPRGDTWLHTSELNDGYDWGRLNLQSVTEQSSMDDFLATAELAGTEFVAEKLNIQFVPAEARAGLLTAEEKTRLKKLWLVLQHKACVTFSNVCAVCRVEEEQKLILTPFERNLEFWRQLWRVIERSDVVVQIVDARNPLLFRCLDLESYVKEVSAEKVNMLLVNKADLLTREQRRAWARHFEKDGIRTVFWSALAEGSRLDAEEKGMEVDDPEREESDAEEGPDNEAGGEEEEEEEEEGAESDEEEEEEKVEVDEEDWHTCSEGEEEAEGGAAGSSSQSFHNSSRLLHKDELLEMFKAVHSGTRTREGQLTVGLVGYPNVGKSSTINTILRNKKVSVSATPGHTKHFQTLYVEADLCLCDCPGLVMPSFVSTKAEMICSGILPIDQMRDHVPATIPRHVLEGTYGINIIRPREDEDPDRPPTSEELLMAYGYMRGFMTSHGQPDQSRSARYILKDYVSGKLLYCHPPPHIRAEHFQPQHNKFQSRDSDSSDLSAEHRTHSKQHNIKRIENVVDKNFFHQENVRALSKGVKAVMGYRPGSGPVGKQEPEVMAGKPWKKHGNRNKKEKVRRITKHLDA